MNKTTEKLQQMIINLPLEERMSILQAALQHLAQERGVSWSGFLFELDVEYRKRRAEVSTEAWALNAGDWLTWVQTQLSAYLPETQSSILLALVKSVALAQGKKWQEIRDTIGDEALSELARKARSVLVLSVLAGLSEEDTTATLTIALEKIATRKGCTNAEFFNLIAVGMGVEEQYSLASMQAFIESASRDKQIAILRVIVDAMATAHGTDMRVILDKISGVEVTAQEQNVKSAVITGILKDTNIDDTTEILRIALTELAKRNHTTPATLLGFINSGLHREWERQYEQSKKENNNAS